MHLALQTEDIFVQVLHHISSDDDYLEFPPTDVLDKSRLVTLLNLALTCGAFTEPTLDELWRRIDYMTNLLKLLPSFQRFPNGIYYLDGPILDDHWDLLDKYAKRIQSVKHVYKGGVDPSVYVRLAKRNKPLLPSLRQFFTELEGPEVGIFASPALRQVHLQFSHKDTTFYPEAWTYLDTVAQVAPDLQNVNIQFPMTEQALNSIYKMKTLRRLEISQSRADVSPINSSFFAQLACLKQLSYIRLKGVGESLNTSTPLYTSANFSSLQHLTIEGFLPHLIPLFQAATFPVLQSLSLVTRSDQNQMVYSESRWESWWRTLFGALNKRAQNLKELVMYHRIKALNSLSYPSLFWDGAPASISADLFQLNLTTIKLIFPVFRSLTNSDISTFAKAWPNLRILHLSAHSIGSLNFGALLIVAEHLPHLESIAIALQTNNLPDPESLPLLEHPLRFIDVLQSVIMDDSEENVAHCLIRLFPNLKTIGHSHIHIQSAKQWYKVQTILTHLHAARKDAFSSCV